MSNKNWNQHAAIWSVSATVICAALAGWWSGQEAVPAAVFGNVIAYVNLALLRWRRRRTNQGKALSAKQSLAILYWSAFERFATVACLFALALGWLKLAPLPLLAGFATGQFVQLAFEFKRNG